MKTKLEWQLVAETYNPPTDKHDGFTYRATIPGGWLVAVWSGKPADQRWGGGATFVPDPEHRWILDDRELKQ
jgi:hypothetical protein